MDLKVLGYKSHLLQPCHPACGHQGSSRLSTVLAYELQYRCKYSTPTTRQLMVEFYLLLAFSRFPLRKKKKTQILVFTRIELTTSVLLIGGVVRGYLPDIDHLGDERRADTSGLDWLS